MNLTEHKELTVVEYNSSGVKVLEPVKVTANGLCFPLHWHERLEFLLIHAGSINTFLGEETITARAGELVIVNAGQLHGGFAGNEGVTYSTIMFEPSSLLNDTQASTALLQPIIDHRVRFFNHNISPNIISIVQSMIHFAGFSETGSALLIQAKAYELIGLLYSHCIHPVIPTLSSDDRFQAVLTFINVHFCEDISSFSLSKQFGYDESYFCRRFKTLTGMTLTNYVRLLRLEKAQKLLCTKNMQITVLALDCGFSDTGYFCRCFKKHFGLSPLQYQKESKK